MRVTTDLREQRPGLKECRRCGRRKPLEDFYRHSRTADRRGSCNRITRAIYRGLKRE